MLIDVNARYFQPTYLKWNEKYKKKKKKILSLLLRRGNPKPPNHCKKKKKTPLFEWNCFFFFFFFVRTHAQTTVVAKTRKPKYICKHYKLEVHIFLMKCVWSLLFNDQGKGHVPLFDFVLLYLKEMWCIVLIFLFVHRCADIVDILQSVFIEYLWGMK